MLAAATLAVLAGTSAAGAAPTGTFPTLSFGADTATAFPTPGLDLFTSSGLGDTSSGLGQVFTPAIADLTSANPLTGTTGTPSTPSFTPTGGYLLAGNVPAPDCTAYADTPVFSSGWRDIATGQSDTYSDAPLGRIEAHGGLRCNNFYNPNSMRYSGATVCLQMRPTTGTPEGLAHNRVGAPVGDFQNAGCETNASSHTPDPYRWKGFERPAGVFFPCREEKVSQWRTVVTGSATSASGESRNYGPLRSASSFFPCR